ncbi:MAG TPA: response regulator transcription factor [Gemmatimonadaceae bacterium]|nr:response regulator transcription factor [Gemmatimonadaceae bacterium]
MTQLTVIDSDREDSRWLRNNLTAEGYEVAAADTIAAAFRILDQASSDLVIVRNPALVKVVRYRLSDTPLLVLAPRPDDEDDLVRAFALGVDDWVWTPVGIRALAARIHAVLRRSCSGERAGPSWVRIGELEVHPPTRSVRWAGRGIKLTPTEYDVLVELIRHTGRCLSREVLYRTVWRSGPDQSPTRKVDELIATLRRKLGQGHGACHIQTGLGEWGGYRFVAEIG